MKKPLKSNDGYMIKFLTCPYCGNDFTQDQIERHMSICYMFHRKEVKANYSKAAKERWKNK